MDHNGLKTGKRRLKILATGLIVVFVVSLCTAQEMSVTDSGGNLLMKVNDEGAAGSLTLPDLGATPAATGGKLYNTGGVLYWQDAQLGAWNRTGTNVHLANPGDSVGIGVADPDAKLEVNGQVKITGGSPGEEKVLASGDTEGLASWMTLNIPKVAYIQGNQTVVFYDGGPGANTYEAQIIRELTISVPGPGTIVAQITGYVGYNRTENPDSGSNVSDGDDGREILRYWFYPHPTVSPTSEWTVPDFHNLGLITRENIDYDVNDTDVYHPISLSKSYAVSSAQDFTVRFCADKPISVTALDVCDVAMQLMFFPDTATALTP